MLKKLIRKIALKFGLIMPDDLPNDFVLNAPDGEVTDIHRLYVTTKQLRALLSLCMTFSRRYSDRYDPEFQRLLLILVKSENQLKKDVP